MEDFVAIAPVFLCPFLQFMKKVKGPHYELSSFEHINLPPQNTISGKVVDIAQHDIIDITQPSQYASQPS